MDTNNLAIPIAFIILAGLILFILIDPKRWSWWVKVPIILVTLGFSFAVWMSIASYKGWPTTAELPQKAMLMSGLVREPEPARSDPGAIYLWLVPFDEAPGHNPLDYHAPDAEPRSFKLPYSRRSHKMVSRAMRMIRDGKPVVLDRSGKEGKPGEGEPGDGDEDGDGEGGANGGYGYDKDRRDFQVYELPPAKPPVKVPQ